MNPAHTRLEEREADPEGMTPLTVQIDSGTFSALGSPVRVRILTSVASRPRTIPELARELGIHRVTLRYHVNYLLRQGLLEEVSLPRPKAPGRPAVSYQASPKAQGSGFPRRHFELLGQLALETLVAAAGSDVAASLLHRRGEEVGRSMIEDLAAKESVRRWTPEAFESFVLQGIFEGMGLPCEVVSRSSNGLVYRSYSCPFLELAEAMPTLVCDALDRGFHEGVDAAVGGARTQRLMCLGHGDPYCQYRLVWPRKRGSSLRSRSARSSKQDTMEESP